MELHLSGRDAASTVLRDSLASAEAGSARVVVAHGEAGVGRSTLLQGLRAAAAPETLVLAAGGHPAEADVPYAGLHQLLRPVVDELDLDSSGLAGALGLVPGASVADDARTALGQELLALVTTAAERRPVLILVDDAHWLDPSSRTLLVFLARRLDADAVCMVLAPESGGLVDWLGVGTVVAMEPLDRSLAARALRARHPEIGSVVVDWLHTETGGVPLLLREAAAALTPAQRRGEAPLPARVPAAPHPVHPVDARAAALPERARRAVLLAALEHLDAPRLGKALGLSGLSTEDLAEAERAGLVRVEDGRCVFTSATARFWVRSRAAESERRGAHRVLAEVLHDVPLRAALHLHHASVGPDPEVGDALERAAAEAARRGGYAEAGRLWELAAGHATEQRDLRRRRASAVEDYFRGGASVAALALIDDLVAAVDDEVERARWHTRRVVSTYWSHRGVVPDHAELAGLARRLVDGAAGDLPAAATAGRDLAAALAEAHVTQGDFRAARDAVAALGPVESLRGVQRVLRQFVTAICDGEPADVETVRGWAAGIERLDEMTLATIGILTAMDWLDDVDACAHVIELCERGEGPPAEQVATRVVLRFLRSVVHQRRGAWDVAIKELALAERTALDTDFHGPFPFLALRRASLLARRGDVAESAALRARVLADGTAPLAIRYLADCVHGLELLGTGRYDEAATVLAATVELERRAGGVAPGYATRAADHCEAVWRLGRFDEAAAIAASYRTAAERSRHPADLGLAARCAALVADSAAMDERFAAAHRALEGSQRPFEVARTQLAWGQRLRRERRKADALPRLEAAHDLFARLGAHAWQQQAQAELAACGRRRSVEAPADSVLATLTPREFAVAREVAAGHSNAEVAARLFISLRTVEHHLSRAYRKLDVPDRAELSRLFAEVAGELSPARA